MIPWLLFLFFLSFCLSFFLASAASSCASWPRPGRMAAAPAGEEGRGRSVAELWSDRQKEKPHQVHNQDPSLSLSSKPSPIMSKLSCGCKYHSPLLFEVANTRYCCLPPTSDRKSSTYVIFRSIYLKASSSFRRINTLLRGGGRRYIRGLFYANWDYPGDPHQLSL